MGNSRMLILIREYFICLTVRHIDSNNVFTARLRNTFSHPSFSQLREYVNLELVRS